MAKVYCISMSLTVILPTLNEGRNIRALVEAILLEFISLDELAILVIDDNSTDETREEVRKIVDKNARVKLVCRDNPNGLTGAIKYGISIATTDYICWMDSDGSMPADSLLKLWTKRDLNLDIIVGSRFVPGGGFKGVTEKSSDLLSIYRNLKNSNDSMAAMILSRGLNIFLRLMLSSEIRDYTSGFILVKRKILVLDDLQGFYGEYCPVYLYKSLKRGLIIKEVPYINLPRKYGVSKTGTNLLELFKTGLPYVTSAVGARFRHVMSIITS
jgi:dolichol-phosphate mannosyltransferase